MFNMLMQKRLGISENVWDLNSSIKFILQSAKTNTIQGLIKDCLQILWW